MQNTHTVPALNFANKNSDIDVIINNNVFVIAIVWFVVLLYYGETHVRFVYLITDTYNTISGRQPTASSNRSPGRVTTAYI